MKNSFLKNEKNYIKAAFISGIALRIIFFIANLIIGGHNCDEVMTSLNAFSLADRLTDINGERLPVYFDTWAIGGQSPFATYLTALSAKVFGNNLFAVRLPALIFSILGFIALYFFAKEVFNDDKYRFALVGLGAVSPWMIFSGAYLLDCNYLGHILMFAMLFFLKAVKTDKTSFYITACFFFSLCFYCYIASILLIPFILIALYLALIIKKKISFKNLALSILTVTVVAVPFIVWGLVITGIIKPFTFLGFSFSDMPNYARAKDTALSSGGIVSILVAVILNLLSTFLLIVANDISAFSIGINLFFYGFVLSGLFIVFGLVKLFFEATRKKHTFNFYTKLTAIGSIFGIAVFCAFVDAPHLGSLYRYCILSYLLVFLETLGIVDCFSLLKKMKFEKILCIYLAVSLIVFTGVFSFKYIPQMKYPTKDAFIQESFGDKYFDCLDFAKDNGYANVILLKTNTCLLNPCAYNRYYVYGDKDYYSIEDEIMGKNSNKDENGNYLVTTDGSIAYKYLKDKIRLTEDFYIIETKELDKADFNENEYSTKNFCYWTVIYKNR